MTIAGKIKCRVCGEITDLSEENAKTIREGYTVMIRCPNVRCLNHSGGLAGPQALPENRQKAKRGIKA